MSGSAKGKKAKQRNTSKKNATQNQSMMYEGSYGNPRVAHTMLSLMGKNCLTKVRNGGIYEGLFHTFSKQMDFSLNVVHKLNLEVNGTDRQMNESPKENELIDEIVYKFDSVVSAQFEDVDLDFAVQDVNETNGETGNLSRGSKSFEKKLEPWDGGGDSIEADSLTFGGLESSGIDGTNGWDANDMFKANEEKYGVRSNYDASLSSYTMPLNIDEEKPENVARATKLAQEIESNSDYRQRIDLEVDDGVTEEEKFSAVVRDRDYRRDSRGLRDSHDRDNDHFGYRDKERGDRDRDQGMLPHRNNRDYNDKHRGRGARMRDIQQRHHQAYPPAMGHSRSMGPGGPPGGDRRNQMSMPQIDGSGPQGKFRPSPQNNIPPRFSKSGSGGHSREDERMKQSEGNAMHSAPYQPKSQRQPRMNRMTNNRAWSNSPASDFMHNSPQMHPDSPAMVGVPQNGSGLNLSRTSSSSSNTSAPLQQGHRKHHSTSSQDDLPPHPTHHMRQSSQHSSSSPTGSPVMVNAQPPPPRPAPIPGSMPAPGQDAPPPASWAAIARGKPAAIPSGDMSGHVNQQSPQGLSQPSQVKNFIHVQENATYTYTPSPSNVHYPIQTSRGGVTMPVQMTPKGHNPQVGVSRGPQQQTILPRQQMQPQSHHPPPNPQNLPPQQVNQQQPKMQTVGSAEQGKHAAKAEVSKAPKKADEPSTPPGPLNTAKGGERYKELHEFYSNFKLSNEVKDSANVSHPQSKAPPRQPPSAPQQQLNQNNQQLVYQQPHPTAPTRPEHVAPQAMGVSAGPVQIHASQVGGSQQMKLPNPPHQGMVAHNHQVSPSPISQQIPVASPSIQHFGTPTPQQNPMQGQPIITGRMSADKTSVLAMQKPVTSPKAENSYTPTPNIHVAVSQGPVVKSSAVYTVSAANPSPIASSHYQPPATQNAMPAQKNLRHSPAAQVASPAQQMESTSNTAAGDTDSDTAALQAGKPLNPEAQEFKPRAPAKPATPAVAARTNTPVPQQQQYVQQGQIMPPMSHIMASAPMYPGQLAQLDPMNPQMPMYPPPMFPQTYLQPIQPIAGQQMPQFAFDQSGQVYHGPGQQAMMPPNARVATMPPNQQQHVPQYTPDHGQPQVFVPIPQQAQFMPQARPHSAHTPTQVAQVTATSPASQSIQQPSQAAHPPAMVQTQHPGGQQHMWIVNPHLAQQQSVPAQYITTVPSAHLPSPAPMTNVTPQQQKGQHTPVAYVAQQATRQYAQYQPSAPST